MTSGLFVRGITVAPFWRIVIVEAVIVLTLIPNDVLTHVNVPGETIPLPEPPETVDQ